MHPHAHPRGQGALRPGAGQRARVHQLAPEARRNVPQLERELARYESEWDTAYAELAAVRRDYSAFGDLLGTKSHKALAARAQAALHAARVALIGLDSAITYAAYQVAPEVAFAPDGHALVRAMAPHVD